MVDKWAKLADAHKPNNSNPPSTSGGIALRSCANARIVDGTEVLGKGQGYLEIALEEAAKTRRELAEENGRLRRWAVTAVNDVQAVLHLARSLVSNSAAGAENTQDEVFTVLAILASLC
jgi:hypothetical protein